MYENERQSLLEFMSQSGKAQRQVSKEIGFSTSVISQFLGGTYTGNNDEVALAVTRYLAIGKERIASFVQSVFYEQLYNTQEVLFACNYAHRKNDIALVSGDAGAGKTTALRHYTQNNVGVIMVTANACTTTSKAILGLICAKVSKQIPGRKAVLMQQLVEQLTDSNRLIIVDEADHLTLEALQAVRNLNDLAGVGVVLAGNDKIYKQMLSPRRGYEFDQIRTRMIVRKRVCNDYTQEEMNRLFPSLGADCIGYLLNLSHAESLRSAKKIYEIAQEFAAAKGSPVTLKHLRDTQKQLLGEVM